MFQAVVGAPLWFFTANPSGRILNKFSKDQGADAWGIRLRRGDGSLACVVLITRAVCGGSETSHPAPFQEVFSLGYGFAVNVASPMAPGVDLMLMYFFGEAWGGS